MNDNKRNKWTEITLILIQPFNNEAHSNDDYQDGDKDKKSLTITDKL